jgi:hypothetical protein
LMASLPLRLMAGLVLVCLWVAGLCVLRGKPEPRWLVAHRRGLRRSPFSGWLAGA